MRNCENTTDEFVSYLCCLWHSYHFIFLSAISWFCLFVCIIIIIIIDAYLCFSLFIFSFPIVGLTKTYLLKQ